MYVVRDLLQKLECVFYKINEQVGIVVPAVYEVVVQLGQAKMFPVDKLLATLLDEQLEVAEANGLIKVSNCKSPCRRTRVGSVATRLTM